jgi:hypothetical protein
MNFPPDFALKLISPEYRTDIDGYVSKVLDLSINMLPESNSSLSVLLE